jgi:uncharacterized protein (DUF2147 family)
MSKENESKELIIDAEYTDIRPLETIEYEINELTKQAQTAAVYYAINIGSRLLEAKNQVPHGEWENWLTDKVNYSQRTAETYIQVYKEYGHAQQSMFGANPQAFANLSFTKLVALLAIPAEEREDFAKEVDAENLSVRELKDEIKKVKEERDAALREKTDTEKKLEDALAEVNRAAKDKQTEIDDLRRQIEELSDKDTSGASDDELAAIRAEVEAEQREKYEKKLAKLEKEKEKLQSAADELNEKIKKAEQDAAEIEKLRMEKAEAEAALADMENKLKLSANPIMQSIDFFFRQAQANIQNLKDNLGKLKASDPEQYDKFSGMIKKTLTGNLEDL